MRIFCVVGVRRSGKTTTITQLIKELKRRGYTVGTIKNIFCPVFTMDEEGSNTYRHKEAGADVVVARGNGEADFIYPRTLGQNEIVEKLNVDFLIMEGDYEALVPRIVCARTEEEVVERTNSLTFAVSGRITNEHSRVNKILAVNAVAAIEKLADLVEKSVPETVLPMKIEASPLAYTSLCQCGCHKGNPLVLPKTQKKQKHIFLTGEKQVGKSTLLAWIMKQLNETYAGFFTRPYEYEGIRRGFLMHSILTPEGYENDLPISVRIGEKNSVAITEVFDQFATAVVEQAKNSKAIVIFDEIGKLEEQSQPFMNAVISCLNEAGLVLGVLQQTDHFFVQSICDRADVEVFEVTKENREQLKTTLLKEVTEQLCILRSIL